MRKSMSGVPYSSRPINDEHSVNTASDADDASPRLSRQRSDDVTAGGQSAANADLDMLIDRYGQLNTDNLPVDTEPGSEEVQQLIKVRKR